MDRRYLGRVPERVRTIFGRVITMLSEEFLRDRDQIDQPLFELLAGIQTLVDEYASGSDARLQGVSSRLSFSSSEEPTPSSSSGRSPTEIPLRELLPAVQNNDNCVTLRVPPLSFEEAPILQPTTSVSSRLSFSNSEEPTPSSSSGRSPTEIPLRELLPSIQNNDNCVTLRVPPLSFEEGPILQPPTSEDVPGPSHTSSEVDRLAGDPESITTYPIPETTTSDSIDIQSGSTYNILGSDEETESGSSSLRLENGYRPSTTQNYRVNLQTEVWGLSLSEGNGQLHSLGGIASTSTSGTSSSNETLQTESSLLLTLENGYRPLITQNHRVNLQTEVWGLSLSEGGGQLQSLGGIASTSTPRTSSSNETQETESSELSDLSDLSLYDTTDDDHV